jgi:hypothetical protein
MEQRRKIIVQTGTEADETLSTPHFVDDEATLLARPVVPLAEPVEPPPDVYAESRADAAYAPRAAAEVSPWKRSTLILIILAAVGVGVASGLAIGLYQSRQKAPAAPVTMQPSVTEPQATTQPQSEPMQSVRVNQPEEQEEAEPEQETEIAAVPSDEETPERNTKDNSDDEARREDKQTARENRKRDEERDAPAVVPDNVPADYSGVDEREDRIERRERRREERREARRAERRRQREEEGDAPLGVPRNVERARQEINRIRDIFEGRQP